MPLGPLSVEHWINDALMAVFFLLIGLELEREVYVGELSNLRSALLPAFAAVGGMAAPALIHLALNAGAPTQAGFGIPMATDIAFALGILALLGKRVPPALKVFVVAFAVIDDLGAIVLIAVVYTAELSWSYLAAALGIWAALLALNRPLRVMALVALSAGRRGNVVLPAPGRHPRLHRWRDARVRHPLHAEDRRRRLAFASARCTPCTSPSHS